MYIYKQIQLPLFDKNNIMFYIIQIVLSLKGMECRVSPSEHFTTKTKLSNNNKKKHQ